MALPCLVIIIILLAASKELMCDQCPHADNKGKKVPTISFLQYARSPNIFYFGFELVAVCTANYSRDHPKMAWTAYKDSRLLDLDPDISQREGVIWRPDRTCLHQVISTYKVQASEELKGIILSCFSYELPTARMCDRDPASFCDIGRPILLEKPAQPSMKLTLHRLPNRAYIGYPINGSCLSESTETGKITWAAVVQSRQAINVDMVITQHNQIVEHKATTTTKARSVNKTYSTFRVAKVTRAMYDMSFSCFAYELKDKHECSLDRFKDCDRSDRIYAQEKPASTTMSILQYHRPPNIFYVGGEPLEVNCTSRRTEGGQIFWTVTTGTPKDDRDTSYIVEGLNPDVKLKQIPGYSAARRSTYSVPVTPAMHNAYISCFPYDPHRTKYLCRKLWLEQCDVSPQLTVIDGPKERPTLDMHYSGYPGAAYYGHAIHARCTAGIGERGTLMFLLFLDSKVKAVYNDDAMVIKHSVIDATAEQPIEMAVLRFRAMPLVSNVSVACFAYNVVHHIEPEPVGCLEDLDPFCAQMDINVTSAPDEVDWYRKWFTYPRLGFFVATLGLLAILAVCSETISAVGEPDEGAGLLNGVVGAVPGRASVAAAAAAAAGGAGAGAVVADGATGGSAGSGSTNVDSIVAGSSVDGRSRPGSLGSVV